ncbi:MAG: hypothetical protein C5B48_14560 [Candidatus Rokuibacteriota bacterium]|nr:MAG: hypothetical protein C5B48_14560 [Candidatus Rokubacteria bacterium]
MTRVVGAALLLLVVPPLALAGARKLPFSGTYQTTIAGKASAALDGRWIISIAPSGRYGIYKSGRKLVSGTASTRGTRATFVDQSGRSACRGAQAIGIYRWRFVSGTLTLTPLSDPCAGRRTVLSTHSLRRL